MRKLLALLIIGIFLVSCTNVQLNKEVKETTTESQTPKQTEVTIPSNPNTTTGIETTEEEIVIEDFGGII